MSESISMWIPEFKDIAWSYQIRVLLPQYILTQKANFAVYRYREDAQNLAEEVCTSWSFVLELLSNSFAYVLEFSCCLPCNKQIAHNISRALIVINLSDIPPNLNSDG